MSKDKNKFFISNKPVENTWLYHFEVPDQEGYRIISEILNDLPISNLKSSYGGRHQSRENVTVDGTLDDVIRAIKKYLEDDYDELIAEQAEVPYQFDYVIMPGVYPKSLGICTRLYDPEGERADVYYECVAVRVNPTRYLLWIPS